MIHTCTCDFVNRLVWRDNYSLISTLFLMSNNTNDILNPNLFNVQSDANASRYDESYSSLRDWSMSSLEIYRPELVCLHSICVLRIIHQTSILYPIFLHCYLDLIERINKTEGAFLIEYVIFSPSFSHC